MDISDRIVLSSLPATKAKKNAAVFAAGVGLLAAAEAYNGCVTKSLKFAKRCTDVSALAHRSSWCWCTPGDSAPQGTRLNACDVAGLYPLLLRDGWRSRGVCPSSR